MPQAFYTRNTFTPTPLRQKLKEDLKPLYTSNICVKSLTHDTKSRLQQKPLSILSHQKPYHAKRNENTRMQT